MGKKVKKKVKKKVRKVRKYVTAGFQQVEYGPNVLQTGALDQNQQAYLNAQMSNYQGKQDLVNMDADMQLQMLQDQQESSKQQGVNAANQLLRQTNRDNFLDKLRNKFRKKTGETVPAPKTPGTSFNYLGTIGTGAGNTVTEQAFPEIVEKTASIEVGDPSVVGFGDIQDLPEGFEILNGRIQYTGTGVDAGAAASNASQIVNVPPGGPQAPSTPGPVTTAPGAQGVELGQSLSGGPLDQALSMQNPNIITADAGTQTLSVTPNPNAAVVSETGKDAVKTKLFGESGKIGKSLSKSALGTSSAGTPTAFSQFGSAASTYALPAVIVGEGVKMLADDKDATTMNVGETAGTLVSGAGQGAGIGSMVGGPVGAGIGAIIGAGVGLFKGLRRRKKAREAEEDRQEEVKNLKKEYRKKRKEFLKTASPGMQKGTYYMGEMGGMNPNMSFKQKLRAQMAMGGIKPMNNQGDMIVYGPTHEQGGVMRDATTELEGGGMKDGMALPGEVITNVMDDGGMSREYYFSDHLKNPNTGNTFAQDYINTGGMNQNAKQTFAKLQELVAGRTDKKRSPESIAKKGGFKVKGVSTEGLTSRQASTLKEHSVHHTKNHIQEMVNAMNNGASFTESHTAAQKKVGKRDGGMGERLDDSDKPSLQSALSDLALKMQQFRGSSDAYKEANPTDVSYRSYLRDLFNRVEQFKSLPNVMKSAQEQRLSNEISGGMGMTPLGGEPFKNGGMGERLDDISGQLAKASKMHAGQSKKIEAMAKQLLKKASGGYKMYQEGDFKTDYPIPGVAPGTIFDEYKAENLPFYQEPLLGLGNFKPVDIEGSNMQAIFDVRTGELVNYKMKPVGGAGSLAYITGKGPSSFAKLIPGAAKNVINPRQLSQGQKLLPSGQKLLTAPSKNLPAPKGNLPMVINKLPATTRNVPSRPLPGLGGGTTGTTAGGPVYDLLQFGKVNTFIPQVVAGGSELLSTQPIVPSTQGEDPVVGDFDPITTQPGKKDDEIDTNNLENARPTYTVDEDVKSKQQEINQFFSQEDPDIPGKTYADQYGFDGLDEDGMLGPKTKKAIELFDMAKEREADFDAVRDFNQSIFDEEAAKKKDEGEDENVVDNVVDNTEKPPVDSKDPGILDRLFGNKTALRTGVTALSYGANLLTAKKNLDELEKLKVTPDKITPERLGKIKITNEAERKLVQESTNAALNQATSPDERIALLSKQQEAIGKSEEGRRNKQLVADLEVDKTNNKNAFTAEIYNVANDFKAQIENMEIQASVKKGRIAVMDKLSNAVATMAMDANKMETAYKNMKEYGEAMAGGIGNLSDKYMKVLMNLGLSESEAKEIQNQVNTTEG